MTQDRFPMTIGGEGRPAAKIVGHRDLPGTTPKACPCFDAAKKFPL
ncbi:Uncharacterised protein [Segatella copri]|nr:Uncharacterised protein [Segatella copri]